MARSVRVRRGVVAPATTPAESLMLTRLLIGGPMSRAELAELTGLSSGAVTKATRPLVEAGYLRELADDREARRVGRPVTPLRVNPERCFFVGVKLTADELFAVITDLGATVRAVEHRRLTETAVASVIDELADVVDVLLSGAPEYAERVASIGVSLAGDVDPDGGIVRYSPFLGWRQVPLGEAVSAATGLPAVVENDVTALTMAEQWFGSGAGASSFALVTVGVGIGCGIVVGGSVVEGARGGAGELGHVPVGGDAPLCECGGTGCVEAIASSRAITARAAVALGVPELTLDRAIELARDDHPLVAPLFGEAGHAIGLALATVANLLGPERIVISGEGVVAFPLFADRLRATFRAQAFGAAAECELIVRPLSFDEWARGAAVAAVQRFAGSVRGSRPTTKD